MFEKYTKKEVIEARKITNDDVTLYRMITELLNIDTSAIPLFSVGDYLCRSIECSTTWLETKEDFESKYFKIHDSGVSRDLEHKPPHDFFSKSKSVNDFIKNEGKRILDGYLAYIDPTNENTAKNKINIFKNQ